MFGILQSCLSQHNIKEDSVQTPLEFNSSLHPYKILDETFPSSLDSLRSLVKHRRLDSQTACGHEGELQKHKTRAKNVKENVRSCEIPLYFRFIWIQTYRIFYFSRRLFAKHHTLSSWCRILSSRSRSRKIRILSISKFFCLLLS